MILAPSQWCACSLPLALQWETIRFEKGSVGQVPENRKGVYTFVVQPGIANHPAVSYLLYVGKVERQGFRDRFRQYLRERIAGEKGRRVHVTEMLDKWEGYLWFCFATVDDEKQIEAVEDALLAAYLPPVNKHFPASILPSIKKLFGH